MLLFYCVEDDASDEATYHQGLEADDGRGLLLHASLDAAKRNGAGPVLVVDPTVLGVSRREAVGGDAVRVPFVPAEALCNVEPYRPPQAVTAAGGYVGCALPEGVALLLIFRRGVWDLPKGMQDPGESIETCARREVREEVGIGALDVLRNLGTTQHAYPNGETYAVKTTHWYLMRTPERSFEPERREGIERVAWARWTVARRHIGYDTLGWHMDQIEGEVQAALDAPIAR